MCMIWLVVATEWHCADWHTAWAHPALTHSVIYVYCCSFFVRSTL